jgi:hypothetical protein
LGFLGSLFSSSVFLLLRGLLERDGFYYGHQGLFYSVFLLLGCWFFLGLLSKYERSLEIGVLCFVLSNNLIYIQWFIASVVPSKGKDRSFFCLVYRLILVFLFEGYWFFCRFVGSNMRNLEFAVSYLGPFITILVYILWCNAPMR